MPENPYEAPKEVNPVPGPSLSVWGKVQYTLLVAVSGWAGWLLSEIAYSLLWSRMKMELAALASWGLGLVTFIGCWWLLWRIAAIVKTP